MKEIIKDYPLVVIGAGAGGLVIAIGAAKAGKKVLLVERGSYGGDCTNYGCVPSKALIASAELAHALKRCKDAGIISSSISPKDWAPAFTRTRNIVSQIREHEEPEALDAMGIRTITGEATFVDPHSLKITESDGTTTTVHAKTVVLATGSHPRIPPVPGLAGTPYLTNETLFQLPSPPDSMIVMGGGPIGCEMAQALSRLGSKVTIVQKQPLLLNKEDPEAARILEQVFINEGIELVLSSTAVAIRHAEGFEVDVESETGMTKTFNAEQLLVATGRAPNSRTLGLEQAGIHTNAAGFIVIDHYGRTSQHHIWAVGDITGHALFTHVAENQARTVLTNLLLPKPLSRKLDLNQAVPRVTYTSPELAHIGLTEEEALSRYGKKKLAVYRVPLSEVDRAICTGHTEGMVKVITKRWSSQILGATIVAPRAGELVCELALAKQARIPLRKLASLIHPYPTYSLALRRAADGWLKETLLPSVKKLLRR